MMIDFSSQKAKHSLVPAVQMQRFSTFLINIFDNIKTFKSFIFFPAFSDQTINLLINKLLIRFMCSENDLAFKSLCGFLLKKKKNAAASWKSWWWIYFFVFVYFWSWSLQNTHAKHKCLPLHRPVPRVTRCRLCCTFCHQVYLPGQRTDQFGPDWNGLTDIRFKWTLLFTFMLAEEVPWAGCTVVCLFPRFPLFFSDPDWIHQP